MDDLVSDRPGRGWRRGRSGPRACRRGRHLEVGVDATAELRLVDFGDAAVMPADPQRLSRGDRARRREALAAGAIPLVLGGDHSITEPCVRACAAKHGPLGMIHFDTHTDSAEQVFGVKFSHGTFIRTLIEDGRLEPAWATRRSACAATGPARRTSPGSASVITSLFAHDVRDLGIVEVVARALAAVAEGPVYVTVDIDVLDPAFVPRPARPSRAG